MFGPEPNGRLHNQFIFSPGNESNLPFLNWEVLDNVDLRRINLLYEVSSQGVSHFLSHFSFDTPAAGYNEFLIGKVPPLAGIPPEKFSYSEASLDDIAVATPYIGKVRSKKAVIGMILLCIDGVRERGCVGQAQFDASLPSVSFFHNDLCLGRSEDDGETVISVASWPRPRDPPGVI